MRNLLCVDMTAGACSLVPLPKNLAALGGRGLASMLVANGMPPDSNPLGPANMLAIAPGLLSGCCASSGRTAVTCKSPLDGIIPSANAGGLPGEALARHGIAAVQIEGTAPPGRWLDLVINAKGAALEPSTVNGHNTYMAMASLGQQHGATCPCLTIGKAGEACLPLATIAFSDRAGQPTRHAGGGSGAVMGSKGLKAIVIKDTPEKPVMTDNAAFDASAKRFADALHARKRKAGGHVPYKGCAPGCVLECKDGSAGTKRSDGSLGKWPDYMRLWSTSTAPTEADYANLDRYAHLCNDLGVDTFAVGEMLGLLVSQNALERGDAQGALDLLEAMNGNPLSAGLYAHLSPDAGVQDNSEATRRFYKDHTEESVILDSLGICLFASQALAEEEEARTALAAMLAARYGHSLSCDDMTATARAVLHAELTFAHPHECCGDDDHA